MGLTVSQSPSSACAHMSRLFHGPDCFTVSTCCMYIDLGSRGFFGVNVALVYWYPIVKWVEGTWLHDRDWGYIIKTHVHGFVDPGLRGVSLQPTRPSDRMVNWQWRSVSRSLFKIGFCFYPILTRQIQPLNYLKTASKVCDLSLTIAMKAHCFRSAWLNTVIGRGRDLVFCHTLKPWNSRASVG